MFAHSARKHLRKWNPSKSDEVLVRSNQDYFVIVIYSVSYILTLFGRLKLHYCVFDSSGILSVVFWDRLAIQLLNKIASQLKFLLKEVIITAFYQDYLTFCVSKHLASFCALSRR